MRRKKAGKTIAFCLILALLCTVINLDPFSVRAAEETSVTAGEQTVRKQAKEEQMVREQAKEEQESPEQSVEEQESPEQPVEEQESPEQSVEEQESPEQSVEEQELPEQPAEEPSSVEDTDVQAYGWRPPTTETRTSVTVRYLDTTGNSLKEDVTLTFTSSQSQQVTLNIGQAGYTYNRCSVENVGGTDHSEDYSCSVDRKRQVLAIARGRNVKTDAVIKIYYLNAQVESSTIQTGKTAAVKDMDQRIYELTLKASATASSREMKSNVALLIDISGSMTFTDALAADSFAELGQLDEQHIYFTGTTRQYGEGVTLSPDLTGRLNSRTLGNGSGRYMGVPTDGRAVYCLDGVWYYSEITAKNISTDGKVAITQSNWATKIGKLYTQRSEILLQAVDELIDSLPAGSQISLISFGNMGTAQTGTQGSKKACVRLDWTELGADRDQIHQAAQDLYGYNGTATYIANGLDLMERQLTALPVTNTNGAYTMVFSDGDRSDSGTGVDSVVTAIQSMASCYSVSVYGEQNGITFMKSLASVEEQFYECEDMEDVLASFEDITHLVSGAVTGALISDYIDPRFLPVDSDGNACAVGDSVAGGELCEDQNGWYISWTEQTIGTTDSSSWEKKIDVKAQADFLGGNVIPTNGEKSGIDVGEQHYTFPEPVVNVKVLPLSLSDIERTVFRGEEPVEEKLLRETVDTLAPGDLKLSQDQLAALLAQGTLRENYQYDETGDTVGELTYTWQKTGENVWELKVEYAPYGVDDRAGVQTPSGEEQGNTSACGTAACYVIPGELQITKTIDKGYAEEQIICADQSFLFRIERRDTKEGEVKDTFYEVIDFPANQGVTTKTETIRGLAKGYYTVTELTDWSWKYEEKTALRRDNFEGNAKENQDIFIGSKKEQTGYYGIQADVDMPGMTPNPAKVSFTNQRKETEILGDVSNAVNRFVN